MSRPRDRTVVIACVGEKSARFRVDPPMGGKYGGADDRARWQRFVDTARAAGKSAHDAILHGDKCLRHVRIVEKRCWQCGSTRHAAKTPAPEAQAA